MRWVFCVLNVAYSPVRYQVSIDVDKLPPILAPSLNFVYSWKSMRIEYQIGNPAGVTDKRCNNIVGKPTINSCKPNWGKK